MPVTKNLANTIGSGDTVAWEAMTLPAISTVLNKAIPKNSDNPQKKDLFDLSIEWLHFYPQIHTDFHR